MDSRPKALLYAYACEPGRGSEPGAGWGVVSAAARIADGTLLVPGAHAPALRDQLSHHPIDGLQIVEVQEPCWARFAKWHRIPWFIAYLAWLRRARRRAEQLATESTFDVVHHVTYSVFWLPTPATRGEAPSVWGPVGGGVTTSRRLWRLLGWRGVLDEVLDFISVAAARRAPATRRTWAAADACLIQNPETMRRLPLAVRAKSIEINHAVFIDEPTVTWAGSTGEVLWVSALESRKAPRLAVRALAATPEDVRLVMVGDGPERGAVPRLARRLGVDDRLELTGRIPRDDVLDRMSRAAAMLFTGLREEGGVALAEAALIGTPIVVLAHGGPRTVLQRATDPGRVALIEPAGVTDTAQRLGAAMTRFVHDPPAGRGPLIDASDGPQALEKVYHMVLEGR